MISRSEWIMPAACVKWNAALCYELGLEDHFWVVPAAADHFALTRRQRMAMCLMIMNLHIRYLWGRDQIGIAFGINGGSTLQNYYERGYTLMKYCPELERCFTKLEGDQAVEFMMDYWGELFAELFEIPLGAPVE